ncbi:PREDICTED: probable protein phosphatase 2C 49 [Populus euphratica]|uniref:protein-serine/threonine phosphatase n=1 Tax=Populus euphratica TaxID=75702 RepID=A0AAJ6X2Q0_POPEU|nr:PREDICTED: probable protein phosphatase 2C 49 [Populus euphratica]
MVVDESGVVSVPVLDVQYFAAEGRSPAHEIEDVVTVSSSPRRLSQVRVSDLISAELSASQLGIKCSEKVSDAEAIESAILEFVPSIRSGSFADIGSRGRYMEDEHIRIDDLSAELGSAFKFPKPSAFYGVFDGHEGPDAAAYIRRNAMRIFFEDVNFPQTSEVDNKFLKEVENSLRKAFHQADLALENDCSVSTFSGTTALTAFVFGRLLMVANAGDCRAVLCRKGKAINMSQDHRPIYPSERRRVEELGGYVDANGFLNGSLSVSRALGDWDKKHSWGSPSPLISEPEFQHLVLTEEDEFLIIGCDGIWDSMSSQHAVSLVRRRLRWHDDPEKCAKDLVKEALDWNAVDNLTVLIVCFSSPPAPKQRQGCSLSAEALCSLRNHLELSANRRML